MSDTTSACATLSRELRALREATGLSLAALAARTPFSKSSWVRYLHGKTLPPWQAVQALCTLAGKPEPRLRALWALADDEWSRRASFAAVPTSGPEETASPRPGPQPAPRPGPQHAAAPAEALAQAALQPESRQLPRMLSTAILAAVAVGSAVLSTGAASPWFGGPTQGSPAATASAAFGNSSIGCQGSVCEGRDPVAMNCGVNPQTPDSIETPSDTDLEIRYNPRCHAAWARFGPSHVGDQVSISVGGHDLQTTLVSNPFAAQTFSYTLMVPVTGHGQLLRACLTPAAHGQPHCLSTPGP